MSTTQIHPTAVIDPSAELAEGVIVGPYAIVMGGARIGSGTRLEPHSVIYNHTELGEDNIVYPGAVIGAQPQDLKFKGEISRVVIGDGNHIREGVTIHRGTEDGTGLTRIGSQCLLMANSHVAHDCSIGDHVILGNNVLLAGHIIVGDHAYICGGTAMHHFTTVGVHAYVGGLTRIVRDIPPYVIVEGNPSSVRGLNAIGLSRRGYSAEQIEALRDAYKIIYVRGLKPAAAIAELDSMEPLTDEVKILLESLRATIKGKNGRAQQT